MFRAHIKRLKPIKVKYRCFRKFDEHMFLSQLEQRLTKVDYTLPENDFSRFITDFERIINKHAPMKTKLIRGNNAPFVTKTFVKKFDIDDASKTAYKK